MVARPLRVLVRLIRNELIAGDRAGLEYYRRAGEIGDDHRLAVAGTALAARSAFVDVVARLMPWPVSGSRGCDRQRSAKRWL